MLCSGQTFCLNLMKIKIYTLKSFIPLSTDVNTRHLPKPATSSLVSASPLRPHPRPRPRRRRRPIKLV